MQRNEGEYEFHFSGEEASSPDLILTVKISKYLDTSLIDIDVQPTYVRLNIKVSLLHNHVE